MVKAVDSYLRTPTATPPGRPPVAWQPRIWASRAVRVFAAAAAGGDAARDTMMRALAPDDRNLCRAAYRSIDGLVALVDVLLQAAHDPAAAASARERIAAATDALEDRSPAVRARAALFGLLAMGDLMGRIEGPEAERFRAAAAEQVCMMFKQAGGPRALSEEHVAAFLQRVAARRAKSPSRSFGWLLKREIDALNALLKSVNLDIEDRPLRRELGGVDARLGEGDARAPSPEPASAPTVLPHRRGGARRAVPALTRETIMRLRNAGLDLRAIAARTDVSLGGVQRVLERHGRGPRRSGRPQLIAPYREVVAEIVRRQRDGETYAEMFRRFRRRVVDSSITRRVFDAAVREARRARKPPPGT